MVNSIYLLRYSGQISFETTWSVGLARRKLQKPPEKARVSVEREEAQSGRLLWKSAESWNRGGT